MVLPAWATRSYLHLRRGNPGRPAKEANTRSVRRSRIVYSVCARWGDRMQALVWRPAAARQSATAQRVLPQAPLQPSGYAPSGLLHLQHAVGNQAVQRLLRHRGGDQQVGNSAGGPRDRVHDVETAALTAAEVPAVGREGRGTPGRPLDAAVRGVMEFRLGQDFGDVRVHTDTKAGAAARSIGARAFTGGDDIVFAAGQYSPHTAIGQNLLAHELAHVVQQRASVAEGGSPTFDSRPQGHRAAPGLIQRQVAKEGPEHGPATDGADVAVHSEVHGQEIIVTETLVRGGLSSRRVTVVNPLAMTRTQRLYRRSEQSPGWTDVTAEALRETYLNPPGVESGELALEWNMPAARPTSSASTPGHILSETIVSEMPPSLIIPYVKDSILTEHFEFTPPGENPYQHWADTIGRRWAATGARKTSFWLNKVVSAASAGVAVGGVVTSTGKGVSAVKAAAEAETRSFKAGVRALKGFDLAKPLATPKEMVEGVRELEAGLKSHLPGPALEEGAHQLTDLQRRALEENVRRVITKTIPAVRGGGSSVEAVLAQIANPRFRFLSQVPAARAALIDALKSIGVALPPGW